MKNILITFLYKEGAGPVFTLEMARGMAKNGYQVYAVLSDAIANYDDWKKEGSIRDVCFIPTGTRRDAIQATIKFFLFRKKIIRKRFQGIRFDCAISTFFHPWALSILKLMKAKKTMTICHDPIYHSGVKCVEAAMTKHYIRSAKEVIVLTKSFISLVKRNYGFKEEKIHYMPHGRMEQYKLIEKPRVKEIYKEQNINFLFFGRIEKYKGLHILAAAYGRLKEEYENITLTVAGSGDFYEYRKVFQDLKDIRVMNEYIPDDEVGWYFSGPNVITVLPYLDASQSGVIAVAMEYLTPIIASDTGGLKSQLDGGNMGVFCEPGNFADLYEKMKQFIENPEVMENEREKMKKYLNHLSWDIVTRDLLDVI
jgi:glycosyltransferase involved in cell wall biosynthesis